MIHLDTDLHPQLEAILEILLLLVPAAFIGYLLAKLLRRFNTKSLKSKIVSSRQELAECQSNHLKRTSVITLSPPSKVVRREQPVVEKPIETNSDNLTIVEGIGPKIAELLNKQGIHTYLQLANTSPIHLVSILKNAGARFQIHDPSTWPEQAKLISEGDIEKFNELKQRILLGKHH